MDLDQPAATPPAPPATRRPPQHLRVKPAIDEVPLGEGPEELVALRGPIEVVEAILRRPRRIIFQLRQGSAVRLIGAMLLATVACAAVYGAIVGSFSGGGQLWAAPLKAVVGLLASALVCLPSLYVFACLSGSRARLVEIAGFIAGLVLLMTLLLVGFAPVAWLFSQSTDSVAWMGTLHLLFLMIATTFGLRFLRAGLAHSQASTLGSFTWATVFLLVLLQMTTALRPFVGTADTLLPSQRQSFLEHWSGVLSQPSPPSPPTP